MIKHSRMALALASVLSAAGCANSVSRTMSSALSSAPDWFDERREEVSGQGYPNVSSVPVAPPKTSAAETERVRQEQEALLAEAEVIKQDPSAQSPVESGHEDPADWAARIRREFDFEEETPQEGLVEEPELP